MTRRRKLVREIVPYGERDPMTEDYRVNKQRLGKKALVLRALIIEFWREIVSILPLTT